MPFFRPHQTGYPDRRRKYRFPRDQYRDPWSAAGVDQILQCHPPLREGNLAETLYSVSGYAQFEYANQELSDLFALADLVISRAGANAICELLALRKPNILIPLPAEASRGDQILNANSFRSQGFSYVLEEANLSNTALLEAVEHVFAKKRRNISRQWKTVAAATQSTPS